MKSNSGPRHAIVLKDLLYVVTELSNQVLVYKKQKGEYHPIQQISTIINKKIESYAGAIKISKDYKNI